MKLAFSEDGWEQYMWWQSGEPKRLKRLNDLIRDTLRTPFTGIGKPKALKGDLRGCGTPD